MAGIAINTQFNLGAGVPIDSRIVLTKSQMANMNDNIMPPVYFAVCSEDSKLYIYNKTNTPTGATGKFKLMESGGSSPSGEPVGNAVEYIDSVLVPIYNKIGRVYINSSTGKIYTVDSLETVRVSTASELITWLTEYGAAVRVDGNNSKGYFFDSQYEYFIDPSDNKVKVINTDRFLDNITISEFEPIEVTDTYLDTNEVTVPTELSVVDITPGIDVVTNLPTPTFKFVNKLLALFSNGHVYKLRNKDIIVSDAHYIYNGFNYIYYTGELTNNKSVWYSYNDLYVQGNIILAGTTITIPGHNVAQYTFDSSNATESDVLKTSEWVDVNPPTQVSAMPAASENLLGSVYQYIGDTTSTYTLGHFYRCSEITTSGTTSYIWQELDVEKDDAYVEHFTEMPEPSDTYLNHVVQYVGESTSNFICAHFYKCVSDGGDPATYAWQGADTETDVYDTIEARPLILTRAEIIANDSIEVSSEATSTKLVSNLELTANVEYKFSINNVSYTGTAVSGSTAVVLSLANDNITLVSSDGNTNLTVVNAILTGCNPGDNVDFTLETTPYVTVNADYASFFNQIGAESTLDETIQSNVEVGGINEGQFLYAGTTFTDVVKSLLNKYYGPSISIGTDKELLNKKGSVISSPIEITATSVRHSDSIIDTVIKGPDGSTVATGTNPLGETLVYSYTNDISTNSTFTAETTDGASPANATIEFEFVNPYYYGVIANLELFDDFTGLTEELVRETSEKTVNYNSNNKYAVFAYDASYGDLSFIADQNGFDNLSAFTKLTKTVAGEVYNVYVSNTPITCTNFKYTFKL